MVNKLVHKELKYVIRQGKTGRNYKYKVEGKLQQSDTGDLWKGMKLITGYGPTIARLQERAFSADEANHFFARFDEHNFSAELE